MKQIPYSRQYIDSVDIREVIKVLKSGWITQGPKIKEFEEALSRYTGAKYAVVVSSGTAALHIACLAAGIHSGDEVITSSITFIASANCILYCKGKPIFADIQEDTENIDPEEIKKKINRRTKGIIPVHFAGHPADLEEIYKIAKKNGLLVIEDAAHALGAEYKGSKIGSCKYSDMTIFSFHPVKSITTGEGGAVLTNKKEYYDRLITLRTHGIRKDSHVCDIEGAWYYEMKFLGYSYRITDIQAALGISQLKRLDKYISRRRKIAKIYQQVFKDNPYFDLPFKKDYVSSAWHLFPIRLKDKYKNKKINIFRQLRKKGLGVQVHYIPVYWHPYYQNLGYKKGICPIAEEYYQREISIPLYHSMTEQEIEVTIKTIYRTFEDL